MKRVNKKFVGFGEFKNRRDVANRELYFFEVKRDAVKMNFVRNKMRRELGLCTIS